MGAHRRHLRLPVSRFVDLATNALAEAREEIDALNVYPFPDGDTGTNMFLTVSAGDATRSLAAQPPTPTRTFGERARPPPGQGSAARCPRQLRASSCRRCVGALGPSGWCWPVRTTRPPQAIAEALREGHGRQLHRRRDPRRGDDADGGPGRVRRSPRWPLPTPADGWPPSAPPRCGRRPGSRWPARRSSCRSWPTPGSWMRAVAD